MIGTLQAILDFLPPWQTFAYAGILAGVTILMIISIVLTCRYGPRIVGTFFIAVFLSILGTSMRLFPSMQRRYVENMKQDDWPTEQNWWYQHVPEEHLRRKWPILYAYFQEQGLYPRQEPPKDTKWRIWLV